MRSRGSRAGLRWRYLLWLAMPLLGQELAAVRSARAEDAASRSSETIWTRPQLLPDWGGYRSWLEALDLSFEVSYTGDFLSTVHGGLARENDYLGNLDLTLTWDTKTVLKRDLGTFFVYGLYNHGDRPSQNVGDVQGVDNIEAPDSAKVFEAWWQKSLFDERASLLVGLYDVNSEFYAVDSAEIFIHSSFGIGGELGTTGENGPSIFPNSSLGVRFKAEPVTGFEIQAAVLDGVPGDPRRPKGTRIRFDDGDGVFVIAEIAHHAYASRGAADGQGDDPDGFQDVSRAAERRRVGRAWGERPSFVRVALGTWLYSAQQPHLSRRDAGGNAVDVRGRPGLYLIADYDVPRLAPDSIRRLSVFAQLGWADGDVGQFEGYSAGGFKIDGLIPFRPEDDCGFAVAASYNGDAFRQAARDAGDAPSVAEIALEWTYRASLTPWLSLQGDLQYIINPGGLRSRADAVLVGFRYVVDL